MKGCGPVAGMAWEQPSVLFPAQVCCLVRVVCEHEICWEFRKSPQLQVVKVFTESSPGFGPEVAVDALQAGPCLPDKQEREVAPEDLISATTCPLFSPHLYLTG